MGGEVVHKAFPDLDFLHDFGVMSGNGTSSFLLPDNSIWLLLKEMTHF